MLFKLFCMTDNCVHIAFGHCAFLVILTWILNAFAGTVCWACHHDTVAIKIFFGLFFTASFVLPGAFGYTFRTFWFTHWTAFFLGTSIFFSLVRFAIVFIFFVVFVFASVGCGFHSAWQCAFFTIKLTSAFFFFTTCHPSIHLFKAFFDAASVCKFFFT